MTVKAPASTCSGTLWMYFAPTQAPVADPANTIAAVLQSTAPPTPNATSAADAVRMIAATDVAALIQSNKQHQAGYDDHSATDAQEA